MQIAYSRRDINKEIVELAWPTIAEQMLIMMAGMLRFWYLLKSIIYTSLMYI